MGLPRWHIGQEFSCQCRKCKRCGFDFGLTKHLCFHFQSHFQILLSVFCFPLYFFIHTFSVSSNFSVLCICTCYAFAHAIPSTSKIFLSYFSSWLNNYFFNHHLFLHMPVCVLSTQLCLILCGRKDCSPPGSPVHGIIQARILERVAVSSSRSSLPRDQTRISCISCTGRQILYHCATWEAFSCTCVCPAAQSCLTPCNPLNCTQQIFLAGLGMSPLASHIYLGILNSIIVHITLSVLTVDYLPFFPTML